MLLLFQKNKKKEKLKSTEQITEGETQSKKKRKKKKKKKENKAQSDPQNSSTEELNIDRTKKENHETDSGSEIKLDKKEIKKKERKKMMKQKKNKEKELLEVQGQEIIDVAEEIGKFSSPHESVKKKRKHTGLFICLIHLSLDTRKPVFRICDQVRFKPACLATKTI